MANETTAWGTVTITTPDERSLIDFIYLKILSEENAVYTTEFDELPECTLNVEDTFSRSTVEKALCEASDFVQNEDGVSVKLAFSGIGRWTFAQNANWFFTIPLANLITKLTSGINCVKKLQNLI